MVLAFSHASRYCLVTIGRYNYRIHGPSARSVAACCSASGRYEFGFVGLGPSAYSFVRPLFLVVISSAFLVSCDSLPTEFQSASSIDARP